MAGWSNLFIEGTQSVRVTDFRVELAWPAHNVGAEGIPAKTGHKFNSTFSLSFVHLSHKRFEIQTN